MVGRGTPLYSFLSTYLCWPTYEWNIFCLRSANLLTVHSKSRGKSIPGFQVQADLPALQYSTQDVMMVLVNMQKEAQRREESFQRSLIKLKKELKSQVSYPKFIQRRIFSV